MFSGEGGMAPSPASSGPSKKGPPFFLLVLLAIVLPVLYSVFVAPLFAASANPDDNMKQLTVRVVILDAGDAGTNFRTFISALQGNSKMPQFDFADASSSVESLRDAVRNSEVYAALYMPATVTADLTAALMNPSGPLAQSYNAKNAIYFIWDESRNNLVTTARVGGLVRGVLSTFTAQASAATLAGILTQLSTWAQAGATVPAAASMLSAHAARGGVLLSKPFDFTEENLYPFSAPVSSQALLVGNILLVVFGLVCTNMIFGPVQGIIAVHAHSLLKQPLKLAAARLALYVVYAGMVAVAYSTIHVALAHTYNTGGTFDGPVWAQVWAASWMFCLIMGLWLGIVVAAAGNPAAAGVALLPMIVFNVLSLNTDVSNPGYKIFWYAPMWHEAEIIRYVMFGSLRSRLGMHIGVLFLWLLVEAAVFVVVHVRKAAAAAQAAKPVVPASDVPSKDSTAVAVQPGSASGSAENPLYTDKGEVVGSDGLTTPGGGLVHASTAVDTAVAELGGTPTPSVLKGDV